MSLSPDPPRLPNVACSARARDGLSTGAGREAAFERLYPSDYPGQERRFERRVRDRESNVSKVDRLPHLEAAREVLRVKRFARQSGQARRSRRPIPRRRGAIPRYRSGLCSPWQPITLGQDRRARMMRTNAHPADISVVPTSRANMREWCLATNDVWPHTKAATTAQWLVGWAQYHGAVGIDVSSIGRFSLTSRQSSVASRHAPVTVRSPSRDGSRTHRSGSRSVAGHCRCRLALRTTLMCTTTRLDVTRT